jgi:acyl carrier protein phosphodiesterase
MFDGEKDIFRVDQNVTSLVSENTAVRNVAEKAWRGDWHRVASIPLNIAHDYNLVRAHSEGDDTFVKRFLNDSGNRAWRTKSGNL